MSRALWTSFSMQSLQAASPYGSYRVASLLTWWPKPSRVSTTRKNHWKQHRLLHLVLKVMRNHFCQIPFMELVTGATDIPLLLGVWQTSRKAFEVGNTVAAIFGKYDLSKASWDKKTPVILRNNFQFIGRKERLGHCISFLLFKIFIYLFLAALGLCCSTWDLRCGMREL